MPISLYLVQEMKEVLHMSYVLGDITYGQFNIFIHDHNVFILLIFFFFCVAFSINIFLLIVLKITSINIFFNLLLIYFYL